MATNYFVSTTGLDTNNGTSVSTPFLTIAKAASVAAPGSVVSVASGNYTGGFTTSSAGSSGAPITYQSTTPLGAVIVGGGAPANGLGGWVNTGAWVTVTGFVIDGVGAQATGWRFGFYNQASNCIFQNGVVRNILVDQTAYANAVSSGSGGAAIEHDNFAGAVNCQTLACTVFNIGPSDQTGSTVHGLYLIASGTFANNVIYNTAGNGITSWHGCININIINNTIDNARDGGIFVGSGDSGSSATTGDFFNVFNNIVVNSIRGIFEGGITGVHNVYTDNLIFNCPTTITLQNGLIDSGTVLSNPSFVNATTHDYRLLAGSPAIGAGTLTDAPSADFLGNPRNGRDDIGAYEFVAAAYAQTITGLVSGSAYNFQVLAKNASGSGPPSSPPITATTTSTTANFSVSGGQVLSPNGTAYIGKGVAIPDFAMTKWVTNAACQPLTNLFPGINMVRLPAFSYWDPTTYETQINQLTALGIVVVIENHQNFQANGSPGGGAGGGGQGGAVELTGTLLTTESNWYANNATHFLSNPRVWFGTNNEPSTVNPVTGQFDLPGLSTWQQATYNAIRGTGNHTIIEIEQANPNQQGASSGLTVSVYNAMSNIVFGPHYYSWPWNGQTNATSQATIYSSPVGSLNSQFGGIVQQIQNLQTITSQNGTVPCGCFEFGPATDGQNLDLAGMNLVNAVIQAINQKNLFCYLAWWIESGSPDSLTNSTTQLQSPYGTTVAADI